MYGLTEAFRSTYLPPEVDKRPDSIGKAIPNAEVLVLREDGTERTQRAGRTGQRGAGRHGLLERPGKNRRALQAAADSARGASPAGAAGDRRVLGRHRAPDEEGFLYFIGRRDEMMKTSGYRVSPTEVEEILATKMVGECVAFGVDDDRLGQAIR
jgi:acyl-coenzyme A synthetase/AMP-(fatty) acid ligase